MEIKARWVASDSSAWSQNVEAVSLPQVWLDTPRAAIKWNSETPLHSLLLTGQEQLC